MSFNNEKYATLLKTTLPVSIKTDEEHERMINVVGDLMKKDKLSPEEERLLDLFADIIRDYEERIYEPIEKGEPHEILRFLIEENNMKQKELLSIFGSEGIISEVLKGKRRITTRHAKLLGEFFRVSPELFI